MRLGADTRYWSRHLESDCLDPGAKAAPRGSGENPWIGLAAGSLHVPLATSGQGSYAFRLMRSFPHILALGPGHAGRACFRKLLCIVAALLLVLSGSQVDLTGRSGGHRLLEHQPGLQAIQPKLIAVRPARHHLDDSGSAPALPVEADVPPGPAGRFATLFPPGQGIILLAQFVGWHARAPPVSLMRQLI